MAVFRIRHALILAALLALAAVLLWPSPADAQCGTQASSCKNCHEVQAQDPVNTEGDWHIQHAFGDFCEFCHAGNVAATEADPAHEGMVYPLADVKASCSSCHPADYQDLAVAYADTLGVEIDTAVSTGGSSGETAAAGGGEAAPAEAPAADAPASTTGGDVVDLNLRYEDTVRARSAGPFNVGNAILVAMLVGLVGVFGVLIWRFEGLGARFAELRGVLPQAATAPKAGVASEALQVLVPALEKASPATLASLGKLLEDDPQRGGQMIEALARIDPRLVEAVRRLDDNDLDLLMALVRDLKERNS